MAKARMGILGGTFNPIHIGHLILAQSALEAYDLQSVLFMPCATPPHKRAANLLPGQHRLAMIERAIGGNPFFEVSEIELKRPGPSYTVDTLLALGAECPDTSFYFIIGADTLRELHKWRRIYEVLDLCRFVTFARPGTDIDVLTGAALNLNPPWPERLRQNISQGRVLEISSTDIRYRVAEGLSIRYLVPPEVEAYINENRLYRK